MQRILSTLGVVLLCLTLVFGRLEYLHRWNEGYRANLIVPIKEATHGWRLIMEFDRPLNAFEVWAADVESNESNKKFTLVSKSWSAELSAHSEFTLPFIARFPAGAVATLIKATFHGRAVDVGQGTSGESPAPTTASPPCTNATGPTTTSSKPPSGPPSKYNYADVLGKSILFYEAQRAGKLPADNRVPWRGDSFMNDGKDNGLDLTGGYFDAGDHVKFGFPMAAMTTIIGWGLVDNREGYVAAGEFENGKKTLKWSLDYFIKAHPSPNEFYGQVGDGKADHSSWGRPEDQSGSRPSWKITASAPGSDLAGETAAAFATGYLVFKDSDAGYAVQLLRHAKELYEFANKLRGKYTDSIPNAADFYQSWSGYGDELGWAAAWLYRATGDQKYMNDVRSHYSEFNLGSRPGEFGWDDKKAGLQILLAKITKDSEYRGQAERFCNYYVNEVQKSPKGLALISKWGSLRHTSNCAFVCLQAADAGINPTKYRDFARQQIHYILGDSGRSFVVGYGTNPPTRPHHRASSCPNRPAICDWNSGFNNPGPNYQTLTGALVGGPDEQDNYKDDRSDYVRNEVATDYNAGFQSALAGLIKLRD